MPREAAHLRTERRSKVGPCRHFQRAISQPVVAAFKRQNAGPPCRQHGCFESSLHGIAAVLSQNHLRVGYGNQRGDPFAQSYFDFRRVDIAHAVQKSFCLRLHGGDHARMAMADRSDAEGAGDIEKAVAVYIGDKAALRFFPERWGNLGRDT